MERLLKIPLAELILEANKIRKDFVGSELELCSIINAKSGLCSEDCKFCAQSAKYSTNVLVYPLKSKDQMVAAAKRAKAIGAKNFGIVKSGNKLNLKELEVIAETVYEIRNKIGLTVCGSLGALDKENLKMLKDSGLERYHHNIETSKNFYPNIVSTHTFKERVDTIKSAKEIGLEVCSGGIIGMGESWQDRIDMANILKDLDVDSVPINLLVPIAGTPLEALELISCNAAIRTICIFRIILKDKIIKIAAGRETILKDFQGMGFMAGANGMIIGGYLTIKGRDVTEDQNLISQIKSLWNG
ncbi:MAG: biotin synthase BioB [Candidatus Omnitrophica bacterium]|nr:biotin synthase BioB [Candidatus Omnitrophota bacterium]MCK5492109.1 biotin synthase BioB [Candidatus Omnitrophota bacterium]